MKKLILKWIIAALAIYATGYVLEGFTISSPEAAVIAAFVLAVLNVFLKPILKILTFPITLLTLGLFLFVIDGVLLLILDQFITGLAIDGFLNAMIASIAISLITMVLNAVFGLNKD